jgi:putative thioredoxin
MTMIIDPNAPHAAPAAGAGGDVIKDGSTQSFGEDVMDASMQTPVIVDFWAPWCGPCKQLTPLLEKLVTQAGGMVRLVKINIDDNQALAAQLRIQSVPTIYAFVQGQPVDGFTGAQPESQLRAFISRLTGDAKAPLEDALEHAQAALDGGDPKAAVAVFSQVLSQDPTNPTAIAGLIRGSVATGDNAAARQVVNGLSPELKANALIAAAISAVELAEQTGGGDLVELRSRVAAKPDDPQARFDLATALFGSGSSEAAIDELLELIRRDREWDDQAARKLLVKIFDALGPANPLTVASRRRLSAILFS